ncbi:MAG: AAA family ATPase [Ruminobacter sp.]|uniref:AAA family ATPase n=1 Tax=Ruminobacter sp. TaxID=2774296 RepID=UPI001B625438|nr:AAA family ATPase [Ruminobacter sp.]MBP3748431.1 AAA family ATPase [Ruminobacter sp.]
MTVDGVEFGVVKVMGSILNPDKDNSFINLVKARDTRVFVDKTDFIEKTNALFNTDGKLLAVTRPRRFGKTVTAHMLSAYYSKGYAGQKIFDNLKITNNEFKDSYEKYLNKYNVIYIDMNTIDGLFDGYSNKKQKVDGVNDLVDYFEYSIIKELKSSSEFVGCLEKHQIENTGLLETLLAITQDLNTKFIFIMDEWDLVYREYCNDEVLQKKFIKLLKNLFKADGGQVCFALAYLTGILPIKKYNSQSALNGFDEYNMLSPGDSAAYVGFTEDEVANIVKSPNCKVSHHDLKEWYEGYKIKGMVIYNPNSVCKAVSRNECISYWSGTSSNEEFISLINMNFAGIKDDIIHLIEGSTIQFNCRSFQNDMVSIENKDDIFSLLVCLGYLGCVDDEGDYRVAYVPNKEIKTALSSLVKAQPWFNSMPIIERSESLFKAITELDGNKTAEIITEIHNSPNVSLLTYNREESMVFCLISGLKWRTEREYECFRELQSGKGSADLIYAPKRNINLPILLIEFKYGQSAEEAMNQIKEKEFFSRYRDGDYPNDVLLIGINYNPKTKDHQCLIEKLEK